VRQARVSLNPNLEFIRPSSPFASLGYFSQGLDPRIGEEESLDSAMCPRDLELWLFTETGKRRESGERRRRRANRAIRQSATVDSGKGRRMCGSSPSLGIVNCGRRSFFPLARPRGRSIPPRDGAGLLSTAVAARPSPSPNTPYLRLLDAAAGTFPPEAGGDIAGRSARDGGMAAWQLRKRIPLPLGEDRRCTSTKSLRVTGGVRPDDTRHGRAHRLSVCDLPHRPRH